MKSAESHEYDNYVMPPYDPTIPPEKRKKLIEESKQRLQEAIAKGVASMKQERAWT